MRAVLLPICLILTVTACRKLDPVPEDADGAAAWLYRHQGDGEDADVAEALRNLRDALDLDAQEEPVEALLAALDADAVGAVGRVAVESLPEEEQAAIDDAALDAGTYVRLADQQGMIIASVIPCAVEDVVGIHVRLDQDEIHGGYDAYDRAYLTDADAFFAGDLDALAWRTDYTVSVIGSTYDATILGDLRWVDIDGARMGYGRAHLPEPGTFESGGGYFRQDYHLDLFYERAPGETVHVFGVWRDLKVAGFHSSNPAFIATVSSRFVESDEEIAALCAAE